MIRSLARWARWHLEWYRAHRLLMELRPAWVRRAGETDDEYVARVREDCLAAHES